MFDDSAVARFAGWFGLFGWILGFRSLRSLHPRLYAVVRSADWFRLFVWVLSIDDVIGVTVPRDVETMCVDIRISLCVIHEFDHDRKLFWSDLFGAGRNL